MSSARVVVIGAGLAGLVAAHRLRTAAIEVVVVEASSRIGGRLRTETLEGVAFEPALHALPRSAPEIGGLIAELGLSKSVRRVPLERPVTHKRDALNPVSTRAVDHLPRGPLRGHRARRLRSLLEWLGGDLDPAAPDRATRLDDRCIADFARVYLGRHVGPELFSPLLETHFGQDPRDTSRQLLFALLNPWGDVEISLAFGLSALPEALAGGLELRTGERVVRVLLAGDGVRLASGEEIRADAVVLAVPATSVAELVPELTPAERGVFETARYLDAVHLAVMCERGDSGVANWIPQSRGGPLSGSIELPSGTPSQQLLLLIVRPSFAAACARRSDEAVTESLLRAAESIHPGLQARLRTSKLLSLPGSLPRFEPGRFRGVQRLWRERVRQSEQRRVFCGDYMVGPHAEGAAASGTRAAAEVRARLLD